MMCYVVLVVAVLCGVGDMVCYVVLVVWCLIWCWWYDVLCGVGYDVLVWCR